VRRGAPAETDVLTRPDVEQSQVFEPNFARRRPMLTDFAIYPTLPAVDLDRARRFYEEKLGFKPGEVTPAGVTYRIQGSTVFLYPSTFAGSNKATAAGFNVTNLLALVAELRGKGVVFEEYDMGGGYKTENGIMKTPDGVAAWFKDTEGNVIGLFQG
jgi:catechol 2,3-dioxygenase-like lactoylglutathione lyase family enzyme